MNNLTDQIEKLSTAVNKISEGIRKEHIGMDNRRQNNYNNFRNYNRRLDGAESGGSSNMKNEVYCRNNQYPNRTNRDRRQGGIRTGRYGQRLDQINTSYRNNNFNNYRFTGHFEGNCHICGKYGHKKSNCWNRNNKFGQPKNGQV